MDERFRGYKLPFSPIRGYRHDTFSRNFARKCVIRSTLIRVQGNKLKIKSNRNMFQIGYTDPVNMFKTNVYRRKSYKLRLDT